MQDLMIALQQRYVNGKDAIELVLESSKKAIPSGVGALREQEIVMGNFLDLFERATFAPEGSAHDKHLKAWIENMQKTGSLELFPNSTTASNVNEGTRILLRERMQNGSQLSFAAVWDAVRTGYLMSCGTGVENVDAALQLLNGNSTPTRVLMAQVRQPFSNQNGQEPRGSKHVNDMNIAELRQEVCEGWNTIQQMQKSAEPYKRRRQNNWQGRRGMDQQASAQLGPKTGVHVQEGAGKDHKGPQKSPAKAQARMLPTSRRTSNSDEDMAYEKAAACLVRPRDEYNPLARATGASMVHEDDSPFSMDTIRT